MPWSYNQKALVEFIKLYKELMTFWHNCLPNQIYDCDENLVSDQINETKKLINFCNLSWEDSLLIILKMKLALKLLVFPR